MKLVYKYIAFLFISGGAISFVSCSDDFLQRESLTALSTDTFWKTETDAINGLMACYDGLQDKFLYNGDPWTCGPLNMECMTDNGGHFNWSGWMAGYDIANGIHTPDSWMLSSYWMASYEEIKRCNILLSNIDRIEMDAATIDLYKAEAIVLRSLMYINLTMTYQDVPYITSLQSFADANIEKTDRATIVADVMKSLKDAAEILSGTPSSRGRISKGAALSLLGRIALYNEKWDEAISAYEQVRSLGLYDLFADYSTLFTRENETCNEIILSVRYEGPGVGEGNSIGAHYDAPNESLNGTLDLAKDYYCTDGLPTDQSPLYTERAVNSMNDPDPTRYENRDPRLKATLYVAGMEWNGNWWYGGAAPSYSTIYVKKYFSPSLNSSTSWDSGQDFYIIRYSEVLLSLAEALVEKGNYNYSEVTELINKVRNRANLSDVEDVEGSSLDQQSLLSLIRHERRVELAFEGLRLFDLYRWKELQKAVDRINIEASDNGFWYEKRNYRGELEYVWPIPLHEMNSNSKITQHSLWK